VKHRYTCTLSLLCSLFFSLFLSFSSRTRIRITRHGCPHRHGHESTTPPGRSPTKLRLGFARPSLWLRFCSYIDFASLRFVFSERWLRFASRYAVASLRVRPCGFDSHHVFRSASLRITFLSPGPDHIHTLVVIGQHEPLYLYLTPVICQVWCTIQIQGPT